MSLLLQQISLTTQTYNYDTKGVYLFQYSNHFSVNRDLIVSLLNFKHTHAHMRPDSKRTTFPNSDLGQPICYVYELVQMSWPFLWLTLLPGKMGAVVTLPPKPTTALWTWIYVASRKIPWIQVNKFEYDNYMLLAFKILLSLFNLWSS